MELKPGYKQTEVGVIPEAWAVWRLKDCCQKLNVSFVGTCEPFYTSESSGVLMLRTGNLQGDKIVLDDCKFVTREFHARNKKSQVRTGDILIARHGNSGNAVAVPPEIDNVNALSIVILRTNEAILGNRFASYCINSGPVKSQAAGMLAGSTQVIINTREVEKLRLPLPPLPEQHAIDTVLSDVNRLLGGLDRLIAKKRDLKQAAVQQLLTGQIRLPEFSGAWGRVRAGDIGQFRGGSGFPIRFQGSTAGEYPFFKVSDMNNAGNETFMETANNYISEALRKQLGATVFPAESIVFAKVGAAVFLERKRILRRASCLDNNMAAFAISASRAHCRFVHYVLLNTNLGDLVSTTALPSLSGSVLSAIEFPLPPLPEQAAIAEVLSDMDVELTALTQRRDKTRTLKQGMMQELLTGRIRLI